MAENKQVATIKKAASERYSEMILKEFMSISGDSLSFDANKKRLSQHLFVKVDATLKELEAKRLADNSGGTSYTWENVNLTKMAVDSVHRIEIGLDALIDNHVSVIPYFNKALKKFDLDLRIGYSGKDYYKRKMAYDVPVDIVYELVYSTDTFEVIKRDMNSEAEGYTFKIEKPFDRGKIVGGFGYIVFSDPDRNKLVIATEADFLKSEKLAQSKKFWGAHPIQMRYKTLVNMTTAKLMIDPDKMNESYFAVEQQEKEDFELVSDGGIETIEGDFVEVQEKEEVEKGPLEKAKKKEKEKKTENTESAGNEAEGGPNY